MANVPGFRVKITYNNKDITADVSRYVIGFKFKDTNEDKVDELQLTMDDTEGKWKGPWYPGKGATLTAAIGGPTGPLMDCGEFEIDECEGQKPPDIFIIKAVAAGVKEAIKTPNTTAYENQTLKQIVDAVSAKYSWAVVGTIEEVQITRVTQNKETDVAFLRRISKEYGYIFKLKNKQIVFSSIYRLEALASVTALDISELSECRIKDKTSGTAQAAIVRHHNPLTQETVNWTVQEKQNTDGYSYHDLVSTDLKVVHIRAENKQQAQLKATAALHRANSYQREGTFKCPGNTLISAGNNFDLTGYGNFSGQYHLFETEHTGDRSDGYETEGSVKQVGYLDKVKNTPAKKIKQPQYKAVQ